MSFASRLGLALACLVVTASAASASSAITITLSETPSGTAVDWSGGMGPHDVIRANLSSVSRDVDRIDLGPVTVVECGSADTSTRGGFEDVESPPDREVFVYLVRGANYGRSSDCLPRSSDLGSTCPPGGRRSVMEVCDRWNTDYPEQAVTVWTGDSAPANCDLGVLDPAAIEDGVRRTNLYRWLVGLPPMTDDPALNAMCQEAAAVQRGLLDHLDHEPPDTSTCFTADGFTASSNSNLAAGYPSLALAVDGYMRDSGVPSLGHRRWLLHPRYETGGFGHVRSDRPPANFRYWSAQWVFGFGPDPGVDHIPYPAPGPFPFDAIRGPWSFSLSGADFSGATVTVTRSCGDRTPLDIQGASQRQNGFSYNIFAWDVPDAVAGEEYVVQLDGVGNAPFSSYSFVVDLRECP